MKLTKRARDRLGAFLALGLFLMIGTLMISGLVKYSAQADSGILPTVRSYLAYVINQPTPTPVAGKIIFHYMPEYIFDIDGHVSSDQPVRHGVTLMHTDGLGNVMNTPVEWSVGDFTGFYPSNALNAQRGIAENVYGSSAVQLQGYTAGMNIHSYSSPVSTTYKLAQILYSWEKDVFPWKYGYQANLCLTHEAAVPNSSTDGGSINYAYAAVAIRDMTTSMRFWIELDHYDSRGDKMLVEMPIWWSEANTAIALGYYGGQRYSTLLPTSSRSITTTWSEWRFFGFCVSRDQLTATMKEMNDRFKLNFSLNPDDYRLELFGIGPEMYVAGGKQGYMSMKVKDVWVYTWIRD